MRKSGHPPQHIKTTKETQEQINNNQQNDPQDLKYVSSDRCITFPHLDHVHDRFHCIVYYGHHEFLHVKTITILTRKMDDLKQNVVIAVISIIITAIFGLLVISISDFIDSRSSKDNLIHYNFQISEPEPAIVIGEGENTEGSDTWSF